MLRLSLVCAGLLLAGTAAAQVPAAPAAPSGRVGLTPSYSLSAGAVFAGRLGTASYVSPSASWQLGRRFSVFGGVTYLRTMPGVAFASTMSVDVRQTSRATHHYLLYGGGQYAVSPRLLLTGTAWKDLSPASSLRVNPYAGFGGNLGSGMSLRADYHITENFSVSGGVRVSNGTPAYPDGYFPWR
ncbi:hypothetical protein [Hymenobacter weizhouensis]|uniref:hypothetical protein n=1 Tax=Hymenobacter sp. YIM 151500-1 TaxID=2987689 RepID=UPI002227B3C6|nr:hypothetical protein [Hymenobacter sp. YIM 151500-1]UYZ65051.1 hypothetical protein OIS53_09405 [Hymenobacter sp. YIM 151500-1]